MFHPHHVQVHGFGQSGAVFLVCQVAMCRMPVLDVIGYRHHVDGGILDQQGTFVFRHQSIEIPWLIEAIVPTVLVRAMSDGLATYG